MNNHECTCISVVCGVGSGVIDGLVTVVISYSGVCLFFLFLFFNLHGQWVYYLCELMNSGFIVYLNYYLHYKNRPDITALVDWA